MFKNKSNLDYVSVGLNPSAMIKMDITNLSYEDHSFNTILCYHVLEHIKNDSLALRNISNSLKPDGCLILHVPKDRKLARRHFQFFREFNIHISKPIISNIISN